MHLCIMLVAALCAVCLTAGTTQADFRSGMNAYKAKDYKLALKEFKADQSKDSLFNLGVMYFKGEGVTADKLQGIEYLKKAAEKGHTNAAFVLGNLYDKGEDVMKDMPVAAKWYRKAAEKGHVLGQFNLGMMYANGEGVEKDPKQAVVWLTKAAKQGHVNAARMLKVMGAEVPKGAKLPKKSNASPSQPEGEKLSGHP